MRRFVNFGCRALATKFTTNVSQHGPSSWSDLIGANSQANAQVIAAKDQTIARLIAEIAVANAQANAQANARIADKDAQLNAQANARIADKDQAIAAKDQTIRMAVDAKVSAEAQALVAKGKLSRRALYELALQQVHAERYRGAGGGNPAKVNCTETERYLVDACATLENSASSLVQSIAGCAKGNLRKGFYGILSKDIHGCGLDAGSLRTLDASLTPEQNRFIDCLCNAFKL